jgi:glycosyltransferase involved in cell wall biosynthesis
VVRLPGHAAVHPVSSPQPRHLAYVTTFDAHDVHAWSGTVNAIAECLTSAGFELDLMGLRAPAQLRTKAMKLAWKIAGARLLRDREPLVTRGYASQAAQRLKLVEHDIVFSPGTVAIGHLETSKPVVFWTDATFDGLVDYYDAFTGLSRRTLRNGHALEQSALDRCSLALYSSEWAASSALEHYQVDPRKVHVVPFGPNMSGEPAGADVRSAIDDRDPERCALLFVGVEWARKGGEVAVAAVEEMNRAGMPTELHVVGCVPPRQLPGFVKVHGFISKREPEGRRRLAALYARAHFVIGPSEADCTPIAFGEACCHGVPLLVADTGGVGSLVRNGVNGHLLPPGASGDAYADIALEVLRDPKEYRRLAHGARREYETRLNWDVAGARVRELVTALIESGTHP